MIREGEVRIPSGCAIAGVFAKDGTPINGGKIVKSMTVMHERSNGLGGGFAGYGIYPQYADLYAFHLFYENPAAREECEKYIDKMFEVVNLSRIPVRKTPKITDAPLIWRYFVAPNHNRLADSGIDERERRAVERGDFGDRIVTTRESCDLEPGKRARHAHVGRHPARTGRAHPFHTRRSRSLSRLARERPRCRDRASDHQ
jgi:glutamate synthase domain-containing protein 1